MTLAARNAIFVTGAIFTFLALLVYAAAGHALLFGAYVDEPFSVGEFQSWFGVRWSVPPLAAYRSLVAAGAVGLIATGGVAVSARLFRRVSSAEIYFMTLFLISLSFELVRIGQPLAEINNLPAATGVLLTRVVLLGRLFGALSLFAAGIYSAGADYPRIGRITMLLVALSVLIVYLVPVDSDQMNATFVHVTGGRQSVDLMLGFLSLATIVNYGIGWWRGHRDRGGAIALTVVGLVVGNQLVIRVVSVLPLSGAVILLAVATSGFVLVNRSYYLWY